MSSIHLSDITIDRGFPMNTGLTFSFMRNDGKRAGLDVSIQMGLSPKETADTLRYIAKEIEAVFVHEKPDVHGNVNR